MGGKENKEGALVVQLGQPASISEIQNRIFLISDVQVLLDRDLPFYIRWPQRH